MVVPDILYTSWGQARNNSVEMLSRTHEEAKRFHVLGCLENHGFIDGALWGDETVSQGGIREDIGTC